MFSVVIDTIATGNNIRSLLAKNKIKVRDFYPIFGFTTPQACYKWFNGVSLPTIDNFIIISAFFGVPIDDIVVREVKEVADENKGHETVRKAE